MTVILLDNCFAFFIYERKNFGGVYGTENNIWIYESIHTGTKRGQTTIGTIGDGSARTTDLYG